MGILDVQLRTDLADPRIRRGTEAQLARRRERIAAGDRAIGWKVGFGAPQAMQRLGLTAPLVGHLMESGRVAAGGTVSLAGWTKPVAEPELAVHMGRDLAGDADEAAVRAAISAIGPAIELADLDPPPEDVATILSGNIFQRHVVLGPADASRAGGRLDGLTACVTRNGAEIAATAELEGNTGEIVAIVRHVAAFLAGFGERLRAGEFVIAGSIVPPVFLDATDEEFALCLAPLGGVEVRFARRGGTA
jgi:2-keto-4-pentenoate hydratase